MNAPGAKLHLLAKFSKLNKRAQNEDPSDFTLQNRQNLC